MQKSVKYRSLAARFLLVGASIVALGSARVARAQPAQGEKVQKVVFDDDLLNADLGGPFGTSVFPPHMPPARTLLIRPRTDFLPELYKSVEHL